MNEYDENLPEKEPYFFYRVTEFVTTFEADADKHEPFNTITDFKGDDLIKCRKEAIDFYKERIKGFEDGTAKFFLPIAGRDKFELGKNAGYSLTLSFVEWYDSSKYYEHILVGEEESEIIESVEIETSVLKEKGYKV